MKNILALLVLVCGIASCTPVQKKKFAVTRTEAEWKKMLTPDQFRVAREQGTERPFANAYYNNRQEGIYTCIGCDQQLFLSNTKFESGTGWPSFYQPIDKKNIEISSDDTFGMSRDEVHCSRCGSHLGHVFDDGPKPTGLRYCMNSASLKFVKN